MLIINAFVMNEGITRIPFVHEPSKEEPLFKADSRPEVPLAADMKTLRGFTETTPLKGKEINPPKQDEKADEEAA